MLVFPGGGTTGDTVGAVRRQSDYVGGVDSTSETISRENDPLFVSILCAIGTARRASLAVLKGAERRRRSRQAVSHLTEEKDTPHIYANDLLSWRVCVEIRVADGVVHALFTPSYPGPYNRDPKTFAI